MKPHANSARVFELFEVCEFFASFMLLGSTFRQKQADVVPAQRQAILPKTAAMWLKQWLRAAVFWAAGGPFLGRRPRIGRAYHGSARGLDGSKVAVVVVVVSGGGGRGGWGVNSPLESGLI